MRTMEFEALAPADLGNAMAGVPEGSPMHMELRLESVHEGVLVTGSAEVTIAAECSRCLDPMEWEEEVEFSELFAYPATDARGHIIEDLDDDSELPQLQDDLLDLDPVLRDAIVLSLPLAPVCDDSCSGLCPTCGERLSDGHTHAGSDPRWAALSHLLEGGQDTGSIDERPDDASSEA
jgi:uncharacterized protein